MPRLTDKQYVRAHKQLKHFWVHGEGEMFSYLPPLEQWQLHDYFQPSKDLSVEELLAHRHEISLRFPSLPHQAGRALAKFHDRIAVVALRKQRAQAQPVKRKASRDRNLSVRVVVNPEPDVKKLSRAIISLALQKAREQEQQKQQTAGTDSVVPPRSHDDTLSGEGTTDV